MSIYQKPIYVNDSTVFDYTVIDHVIRTNSKGEEVKVMNLKHGDEFVFSIEPQTHQMIGSVASAAIEGGDCPLEAVERAKKNGHELYYTFGLSTCISKHETKRKTVYMIPDGCHIYFEGKLFTLHKSSFEHSYLKEA